MEKKLFFIVVIIGLISISCNNDSLDKKSNLKFELSFGNDGPGLLTNPYKLSSDYENFIYVSDPYRSKVYQYNLDGNFVREIGSRGRGPGELVHASVISADPGLIVVEDQGNKRTQIYDSNGELKFIFAHLNSSIAMEIHNEKIYSFSPSSFSINSKLVQDSLFVVTDFNGNEMFQFGEMKYKNLDLPLGTNWPSLKISGQKLHVAYIYFPIYEVYDMLGNKEFEVNLKDLNNKNYLNEDYLNTLPTESVKQEMEAVIRAIDVVNSYVFIMRQNKDVIIDKYFLEENTLTYEETYRYSSKTEGYFPIDMIADPTGEKFYILELGGQPKVSRYSIYKD